MHRKFTKEYRAYILQIIQSSNIRLYALVCVTVWNIDNVYSKINAFWWWWYWWYNACYFGRKLIIWKAQILFKVHLQKYFVICFHVVNRKPIYHYMLILLLIFWINKTDRCELDWNATSRTICEVNLSYEMQFFHFNWLKIYFRINDAYTMIY